MRKIEQEMLYAIRTRKNWKSGNTKTIQFAGPTGPVSQVFLHGHHIADVCSETGSVYVDLTTLRQWPTVTTKSRLRALGADLVQKRGVIYLNGSPVANA
jgi:hypothetical protein